MREAEGCTPNYLRKEHEAAIRAGQIDHSMGDADGSDVAVVDEKATNFRLRD